MRVVRELGGVCRDLRLEITAAQGLKDTDYQPITSIMRHGSGRNWRTLRGFEEGTSNPSHLDDVVGGYSQASGKPIAWIWREAMKRAAKQTDDPVETGRQLEDAIPKPSSAKPESAGKPRATRRKAGGA